MNKYIVVFALFAVKFFSLAQTDSVKIEAAKPMRNFIKLGTSVGRAWDNSSGLIMLKYPKFIYERIFCKRMSGSAEFFYGMIKDDKRYSQFNDKIFMLSPQFKYYLFRRKNNPDATRLFVALHSSFGYRYREFSRTKVLGYGFGLGYQNYITKRLVYSTEFDVDFINMSNLGISRFTQGLELRTNSDFTNVAFSVALGYKF